MHGNNPTKIGYQIHMVVIRSKCGGVIKVSDFFSKLDSKSVSRWFDSHYHHLYQFGFLPLCITYSIIKNQLLSCHVYVVWKVKNPLGR